MAETTQFEISSTAKAADSSIDASKLRDQAVATASGSSVERKEEQKSADANQALVSQGLVPDTKITNEWTMAVDLRADRSITPGNEAKLKQLKELAEKTKNSSVTIVAQIAIEGAPPKTHGAAAGPNKLERYIIRDGKITKSEDKISGGYVDDLKDLLRYASREAPSKKLGLIEHCHGGASGGLSGVGGQISMDQFVGAIKDGIAGSEHKKMDIVDFDACVMGNARVMDKMKDVTNNVVASELNESDDITNGQFFAQNTSRTVSDLLAKPAMSGKQLAADIVQLANEGVNDGKDENPLGTWTGTRTLAQFDLTKLPDFENKLDQFGKALIESEKDSRSKATIDSLVKTSQIEDGDNRDADLKTFAEGINENIKSGKLLDPDGKLAQATRALQEAQEQLISSYHGSKRGGYDKLGGMSVFLPRPFGSTDSALVQASGGKGTSGYQMALDSLRDCGNKNAFAVNRMEAQLKSMQGLLGGKYGPEMQTFNADWEKVKIAANREEFDSALKRLKDDFEGQPQSFWDDYKKGQDQKAIDAALAQEDISLAPNWGRFTAGLYDTDRSGQ